MKILSQILILALLTLGSCTSSLYPGGEYDDLYYSSSDQQVKNKVPENNLPAIDNKGNNEYFDNKYAADTLVSDKYSDAVDYQANSNGYNNEGYDYYDNSSYASRLNRFYGNYFDPYWRDPFYMGFGSGLGYSGYPYYGYNPYSYGGFYGDYYGYGYPGYYGGYGYGYPYYGMGFYSGCLLYT